MGGQNANSAELNLIYMMLLRQAGIESWPLLLSTRQNGRLVRALPLLSQFDHLVVEYLQAEDSVLADLMPGGSHQSLALASDNGHAYRMHPRQRNWRQIDEGFASKTRWDVQVQIDSNRLARYDLSLQHEGYGVPIFGQDQLRLDQQTIKVLDRLQKEGLKFNRPQANSRLTGKEGLAFYLEREQSGPGDHILLPGLHLFSPFERQAFKTARRQMPIDFGYEQAYQIEQTIHLPAGYHYDEASIDSTLSIPLRYASLRYQRRLQGRNVQMRLLFKIARKVPSRYYAELRAFIDTLLSLQAQPVYLRREEVGSSGQ